MSSLGPLILPKWGRIYHSGLYKLGERMLYTGRGLGLDLNLLTQIGAALEHPSRQYQFIVS